MIILFSGDESIVEAARDRAVNFPEIYGEVVFAEWNNGIPMLGPTEDVFLVGHGRQVADEPLEIGDPETNFWLNGTELFERGKGMGILPDMYQGRVFVDCCWSADANSALPSLIDSFNASFSEQFDGSVFGRSGEVGGAIPLPGDGAWIEAGVRGTRLPIRNARRHRHGFVVGDSGNVSPAGPWDPGRQPFVLREILPGMSDPDSSYAVTTADQELAGEVNMSAYQLKSPNTKYDFFSVYGSFNHGVSHGPGYTPYDPSANWLSVGYYATQMSLVLQLVGDGPNDPRIRDSVLWDYGPGSTVGQESTGFNLGGNLSGGVIGDEPIVQAGVSAGFSASYACPEVSFGAAALGGMVRWDVDLPGVGSVSPGVPANPHKPSYDGYKWYFAAIYALPKGTPFKLAVRPTVTWEYDWYRGSAYDTKIWTPTDKEMLFVFQPQQ